MRADGVYDLDEKAIETLARGQFEGKRPTYELKEEQPEDARKVLKNYLNADGTLKQIPPLGNKTSHHPELHRGRVRVRYELHGEGSQHHPAPLPCGYGCTATLSCRQWISWRVKAMEVDTGE